MLFLSLPFFQWDLSLRKSLDLSILQFPHLKNEAPTSTLLMGPLSLMSVDVQRV